MDRPRRTDAAAPSAKAICATSSYVINEGETRALVVDVSSRIEVVLVKRIEEGKANLEVPSFADSRVFRKRDIHILPMRTADICDAWPIPGEPVASSAPGGRTGYAERSNRFEGRAVEELGECARGPDPCSPVARANDRAGSRWAGNRTPSVEGRDLRSIGMSCRCPKDRTAP